MDLDEIRDKLEDLHQALQRKLGDPALPGDADAVGVSFKKDLSGAIGNAKWTLGATATAGIRVLNAESDSDDDGIFGTVPEKFDTTDATPVLEPAQGAAYVKYALAGTVKASIGGAVSSTGNIKVSGQGRAALGAYLKSADTTRLEDAIKADLADFPFPLHANSVRELGVGDACYVTAGGSLAASLSFSWGDLFNASLLELREFGADPIVIGIGAEASVDVSLEISDTFRIVFVGLNDRRVRVLMHRAKSNAFAVEAAAVIRIAFANPEQVRAVLSQITARLLGPPRELLAQVEKALEKATREYDKAVERLYSLGGLTEKLDGYFAKLGIDRALAQLVRLQEIAEEVEGVAPEFAARVGLTLAEAKAVLAEIDALPGRIATKVGDKLDVVLEKLGIGSMLENAQEAVAAINARLARIEKAILSIAERKIELGVSHEYRRLSTAGTLFDAELERSHAKFAARHSALLGLDLATLLADGQTPGSGVALRLFLHQKTVKRTFVLGLGVGGLGNRSESGRQWVEVQRIARTPDDPSRYVEQRQLAFKGWLVFEESSFGEDELETRGDVGADFSAEGSPAASGAWSLNLAQTWRHRGKASDAWLARVADQASLWGVGSDDGAAVLAQRLRDEIGDQKGAAEAVCTLAFGNAAFQTLAFTSAIQSVDDDTLTAVLAASLPYWQDFEARRSLRARRSAYREACRLLLAFPTGTNANVQFFARECAKRLRDVDAKLAAREEALSSPTTPQYAQSFARVARRSGSVRDGIKQLREAAEIVSRLRGTQVGSEKEKDLVRKSVGGLEQYWAYPYALRWQGRLLLELARRHGVPERAVVATLKVTLGPADAPTRVVVISN